MQHTIDEFIFAHLVKLKHEITSRKPILHLELDTSHHIKIILRVKLDVEVVDDCEANRIIKLGGVEDDVVEREVA